MANFIIKLTKGRFVTDRRAEKLTVSDEYEWKGWDAWVDVKK